MVKAREWNYLKTFWEGSTRETPNPYTLLCPHRHHKLQAVHRMTVAWGYPTFTCRKSAEAVPELIAKNSFPLEVW